MADTGGITATVVNIKNNLPIAGASVKLSGPADEATTTGPDGKFKFSNLAQAYNYVVDISDSGYQSERYEDIVVLQDNVTNLWKLMLFPNE